MEGLFLENEIKGLWMALEFSSEKMAESMKENEKWEKNTDMDALLLVMGLKLLISGIMAGLLIKLFYYCEYSEYKKLRILNIIFVDLS
jgi:hypothetical protein